MKILQMMAGAEHGGAETAFVDMCITLHEAGEQVEVITRENPIRVPRLEQAGITVHTAKFGGRLDVLTKRKVRKVVKHFQPDIVQSWMSRASMHAPKWEKRFNIPRFAVASRLGGYYKLKYFKNTEYFTTITPMIKTYLEDNGVEPDKVRHINNFAETEEVDTPASRAAHDIPDKAPLLLGLGRLHDDKAFDVLIRAVSELPEVYLWIAGEGPLREELEGLIRALNVEKRVKLLGWRSDRAALFKASDICTFISRDEPFGTVFVQSWAQKTPVIVSDADGPRQFVRDGEDGLVVPKDDVEALRAAIEKLIDNNYLQKNLIENGFARYENEFTKAQCVKAYLDFYKDIRVRENLS